MSEIILDPFQTPSWRWEQARQLVESKKRFSPRRFDEATHQAQRFLLAKASGANEIQRHFNVQKFPYIYQAERIHHHDNQSVKWGIQARLLANEDHKDIARKVRINVNTVTWYERLFYNVSDSLDSPDYILNVVIGESIHRGLRGRDYDLLWKLYGFFRGPIVLDSLVFGFTNPQHITHKNQVDQSWTVDGRSHVCRKSALAAHTLPVDFAGGLLLEHHHRLLEIEKSGDNTAAGAEALLYSQIEATCKIFGQALHPTSSRDGVDVKQLGGYDGAGIELRAAEMVARDAGLAPAGQQTVILDIATEAKNRKFIEYSPEAATQ